MPTPLSATKMFESDTRVTVQLMNEPMTACWSSRFTLATRNEADQYSAKTP